MASTDMTYTGHHPIHGGLQRHSMGDFYPWISVVQGSYRENRWHYYINGCTGEESPKFRKSANAEKWLRGAIACREALAADRALH